MRNMNHADSLTSAKAQCWNNEDCGYITSHDCNGEWGYGFCSKRAELFSKEGSCVFRKG